METGRFLSILLNDTASADGACIASASISAMTTTTITG